MNINICAIVLNYKTADITCGCLLSLANKGIKTVRLLDNSECQEESEKLNRKISLIKHDYHLIYSISKRNLGFSAGINSQIKDDMSDGGHDAYLLINSDATLPDKLLEKMVNSLSDKVYAATASIQEGNQILGVRWYQISTGLQFSTPQFGCLAYPTGCCILVKKELVNNSRLYDEGFFFYGEDVELAWRMKKSNLDWRVVNEMPVIHQPNSSSINGSEFYEYNMIKAHWLLAEKLSNNCFFEKIYKLNRCIIFCIRSVYRSLIRLNFTPISSYIRFMAEVFLIKGFH